MRALCVLYTRYRGTPPYFGEVRRFALLSFAEEQALGRRITRGQRRVRWALYTAPIALPTLRRLWQQAEQEALAWHELVQPLEGGTPVQSEPRVHVRQAIRHLEELTARRCRLAEAHEAWPLGAAQERQVSSNFGANGHAKPFP